MNNSVSIQKPLKTNTENYFQKFGALIVLAVILVLNFIVTPILPA
jgi:hypothetical protein